MDSACAAERSQSNAVSVFFVKKIFIYLLKLNGTVQSHANAVFNHQLCKPLSID